MDYISTKEAAANWGVSTREVQRLLREGRIPEAKRYGNYWMIPNGTVKPDDRRRAAKTHSREKKDLSSEHVRGADSKNEKPSTIEQRPELYSCIPFPMGNPEGVLQTVDEEYRELTEAYINYYRGDFKHPIEYWQKTSRESRTKLTAASLAIAAAMITGDDGTYKEIMAYIDRERLLTEDPFMKKALTIPVALAALGMAAPNMAPDWIKSCDFAEWTSDMRANLIFLYLLYLKCNKNHERLLECSKVAVSVYAREETFTHLDIYFALLTASAAYAQNDMKTTRDYVHRAVKLAVPAGFWVPLAEYLPGLGGTMEECLAKESPTLLKKIQLEAPRIFKNWTSFHNRYTKDNISLILTTQEFHIALMLARGATYSQAAKAQNLSVSRVRSIVMNIYSKLYVNNKQDMAEYIL